MKGPTIGQARAAYNALRAADTTDQSTPDGRTVKGTYAFKDHTSIRLAAVRLMNRLEQIHEATQDELSDLQLALANAKTAEEHRDADRALRAKLREPLDPATLEEVAPERYGLRTSAMGKKVIDRVGANVWKDLGPWFIEDVPFDELTEDGTANRADRRK